MTSLNMPSCRSKQKRRREKASLFIPEKSARNKRQPKAQTNKTRSEEHGWKQSHLQTREQTEFAASISSPATKPTETYGRLPTNRLNARAEQRRRGTQNSRNTQQKKDPKICLFSTETDLRFIRGRRRLLPQIR